uniref:Uncharacterized protein n=1 Tax=Romanomermis culicivorax TaxID=13658 RepID=A0A915JTH8_ROMCU
METFNQENAFAGVSSCSLGCPSQSEKKQPRKQTIQHETFLLILSIHFPVVRSRCFYEKCPEEE